MPSYEYRCKACGERFDLFYKTYADYDAAKKTCPHCGSDSLARLIGSVRVATPARDYTRMNANEMLSVLESGDSRQVGEMFSQVGGAADPRGAGEIHETAERLKRGESIQKVERDLAAKDREQKKNSSGSA
ncbi:MAG: FmdB family zinc ribbon protein [Phototrophicaceae bacterium]